MSIYKGTTPLAGIATPHLDTRNIGQIIPATMPLSDAGLHLLDGSLLSGNGSYSEFVTYMASMYVSNPELFATEADWQTSITNYGVCGKFVYDSVNNTVRLPKKSSTERHLVKSTISGTDWFDVYSDGWCDQGGVFTGDFLTGNQFTLLHPYKDTNYTVITNAIKYNTTAAACFGVTTKTTTYFAGEAFRGGDGNIHVGILQWEAKGYADVSDLGQETIYQYIVIANSTKTEIEVDIDEIATDLNGKVDKSSLEEVHCVVETYTSGSSWYRLYDDGWCEQGGTIANGHNSQITVSLLQEYINTNYYVSIQQVEIGSTTSQYFGSIKVTERQTDNFTVVDGQTESPAIVWKTEGYIR